MSITTSLIILCIYFMKANCTSDLQSETTHIRGNTDRNLEGATTFPLDPTLTESVVFQLSGKTDQISVGFKAEELDHTQYSISINRNKELESKTTVVFPEPVLIKLNLNYETRLCQILINEDDSLDFVLSDDSYVVSVDSKNYVERKFEHTTEIESEEYFKFNNNLIILIVTLGVCVVAVIAIKMVLSAKKRRNLLIEDLSAISNSAILSSTNKPALVFDALSIVKKSSKAEDSHAVDFSGKIKKESNKFEYNTNNHIDSLASTSPTYNNLHKRNLFAHTNAAINSINDEGLPAKDIEYHCAQTTTSIVLEGAIIKPVALSPAKDKCCGESQNGNHPQFFKKPSPINSDYLEVELDMGMDDEDGALNVNSIKALVRKMKEEGTIGADNDPSVDSDDDDQYEAPQLPNYICCMLCFQGKRNTIVGPCRHVFACEECVDDLLQTYKICVLCANKIDGYEMLED